MLRHTLVAYTLRKDTLHAIFSERSQKSSRPFPLSAVQMPLQEVRHERQYLRFQFNYSSHSKIKYKFVFNSITSPDPLA